MGIDWADHVSFLKAILPRHIVACSPEVTVNALIRVTSKGAAFMSLMSEGLDDLSKSGVGKDLLLEMYSKLILCRFFDRKVEALFNAKRIRSDTHLYTGQEAVGVGALAALGPSDSVISNFRGHGHAIARGVPVNLLMAELYGKSTGTCKGLGGSMHCPKYPELNLTFASAVVGAGIPIAAGLALESKLRHKRDVTLVFFGDGAVNSGAFHEGVNLAAVWRLPLILICENNQFAMSTPVDSATAGNNIARRAEAYGIEGVEVDGNDVIAVYVKTAEMVRRARDGSGPALIEAKTFRFKSHSTRSPDTKAPDDLVEKWKPKDPILRFEKFLTVKGIFSQGDLDKVQEEATSTIEESVKFSENSPSLPLEGIGEFV